MFLGSGLYKWNTGVDMCSFMFGLPLHVQTQVRSARPKRMHDEPGPGPEVSEWFMGSLHFRKPEGAMCMHRKAMLIPEAGGNEWEACEAGGPYGITASSVKAGIRPEVTSPCERNAGVNKLDNALGSHT